MLLFPVLVILGQFYKYSEVSDLTDMHRYDPNILYKNKEVGESFKCYHLFQVQKYSFTFSQ